jgi:hypothetical protein
MDHDDLGYTGTGLVKKYYWVPRKRFMAEMMAAGYTEAEAHFRATIVSRRAAPPPPHCGEVRVLLLLKEEVEVVSERRLTIHILG